MPPFLAVTTITLVGGFSVFDIVSTGGSDNATNVLGANPLDKGLLSTRPDERLAMRGQDFRICR